MKIAVIADTHFGCRADSQVFLDQQKKFFEEVLFPEMVERGINKLIHLGDLFDKTRIINVRTLRQVNDMFFRPLKEYGIQSWIIPGNHDSYYRDTLEVTTVEEVLQGEENWRIMTKPTMETLGGRSLLFLPWSFDHTIPTDLDVTDVLCTHLDIVGYEQYRGSPNFGNGVDPSILSAWGMVLSGHYHHPNSKGNIHYIGAPIEMTWSDFGGPRGFQILDLKTMRLEYVQNPNKTFRKIAYDDTGKTLEQMLKGKFEALRDLCVKVNVKAVNDPMIFDQFIKRIEENNPFSLTITQPNDVNVEITQAVDEKMNTLDMILGVIEKVELSTDKDTVKEFMQELYFEAERLASLSETV